MYCPSSPLSTMLEHEILDSTTAYYCQFILSEWHVYSDSTGQYFNVVLLSSPPSPKRFGFKTGGQNGGSERKLKF